MVFSWLQTEWSKVKSVLTRTAHSLSSKLKKVFSRPLDEKTKEELESLFYDADLGIPITKDLIAHIDTIYREEKSPSVELLLHSVEKRLVQELSSFNFALKKATEGPTVLLIIGSNGQGKTTSIAKLSHLLQKNNASVLIAACDTFRAAAQEQLELWAKRTNCDIVRGQYQQDPASVAFDAIKAAIARKIDYVIIDTAGRLENKAHLMKELEKIVKICKKASQDAPHETLLVLDATMGQNGIQQARIFHATTPLSGLIVTKLDGSAKGGVALAIQKELKIPAKFIGTGEGVEDLAAFEPTLFIKTLLDLEENT